MDYNVTKTGVELGSFNFQDNRLSQLSIEQTDAVLPVF